MKRISFIVLATLSIAPGVAKAFGYNYYTGYEHDRVRWSIYAHSLIAGDLYYSPYAYTYGQSGLVPYWVRYSPYAFGLDHPSGLVNDYVSSSSAPCSIYYYPAGCGCAGPARSAYDYTTAYYGDNDGARAEQQRQASYAAQVQARRDRVKERQQARQEGKTTAESGGYQIVATYLRSKNIDFKMNRLLQIGGKTISADFELAGGTMTIKYWDPAAILALDQQAPYRRKAYESYLQSWTQFAQQYQHAGGTVYSIISADSGEILAKLTDCSELSREARAYAIAQPDASTVQRQ